MQKIRLGDWIQTYTQNTVWLLDAKPKEIHLQDIAHSLSLLCRFNGHVRKFYSVAQHSILVSEIVPEEYMLQALLHDATEAYLGDVVSPLKPFLENYVEIENNLAKVIARRFGYRITEKSHRIIKWADKTLLATEGRDMFKGILNGSSVLEYEPLKQKIKPWGPGISEKRFLNRFKELYELRTRTKIRSLDHCSVW